MMAGGLHAVLTGEGWVLDSATQMLKVRGPDHTMTQPLSIAADAVMSLTMLMMDAVMQLQHKPAKPDMRTSLPDLSRLTE